MARLSHAFDPTDLPDELSRMLYDGSLRVARDLGNPIRQHFFAAGFRELFSHVLHTYAPDKDVRACVWFRQAADTPSVTRKQRATYATQGGLTDEFVAELGLDIGSVHKRAISAIDELSKFTHVRPDTVVTDDAEISAFVDQAVNALKGLITSFRVCRQSVAEILRDNVYNSMMESFFTKTFEDIDILAGKGYEVDLFVVEEQLFVESIDAAEIAVRFTGVAPITLHYGSRDDATEVRHDFPFSMRFSAPVGKPRNLKFLDAYFDDRSWYE